MTFYDRLKTLVVESKKSFNQVERELGYPRNALANYRLGKQPSARRLSELADFFDVSDEYLLEKSDDRDHKKIQKLFNKLNNDNRQLVMDFIQEKLEQQAVSEVGYTTVTITSFIYRGDYVWQQGRLDSKVDVPSSQIPEEFHQVIEPVGSDFFTEAKDGDLLFVKYDKVIDFDNIGGFIFNDEKFVRVVTSGGRLLYIHQDNPDFAQYIAENNADTKEFPQAKIVDIFHTRTRSWEKENQ
ncbi:MAG: helix-turn-helix domain-containing protein [Lactococcus sp.]